MAVIKLYGDIRIFLGAKYAFKHGCLDYHIYDGDSCILISLCDFPIFYESN